MDEDFDDKLDEVNGNNNISNDPNEDDFDDLWEDEDRVDPKAETKDDASASDTTDDEDDEGESSTNETEDEEDTNDENETSDSEIELDLAEGFNEELVAQVETLAISDQLYLSAEKVRELFDGTQESYDVLMTANKEAISNTAINSIYDMLPAKGKDFFEYLISTGGSGDLHGWLALEQREAELASIDLASMTEDQAKAIIKSDHEAKGFSAKQSKYIMEAHEDNADLIDEAKILYTASATAATQAKADKLEADTAKVNADKVANKARQASVVKAINDTKFSTHKQEEIFNLIYTNDESSNNTRLITMISNIIQNKPKQLVQLATLFDGYELEKGFNNARLKDQIKSEVTKTTKSTIRRKTKPASRGRQTSKDKLNHAAGIEDWLSDVEL